MNIISMINDSSDETTVLQEDEPVMEEIILDGKIADVRYHLQILNWCILLFVFITDLLSPRCEHY